MPTKTTKKTSQRPSSQVIVSILNYLRKKFHFHTHSLGKIGSMFGIPSTSSPWLCQRFHLSACVTETKDHRLQAGWDSAHPQKLLRPWEVDTTRDQGDTNFAITRTLPSKQETQASCYKWPCNECTLHKECVVQHIFCLLGGRCVFVLPNLSLNVLFSNKRPGRQILWGFEVFICEGVFVE